MPRDNSQPTRCDWCGGALKPRQDGGKVMAIYTHLFRRDFIRETEPADDFSFIERTGQFRS